MDHRTAKLTMAGFTAVWEFVVDPDRQAEFELHYGPDGTWVRLFRLAPGYLGSELLSDRADPSRYVTIDRWETPEHWRAFRRQFGEQYEALDRRCEELMRREAPLGEYAALPRR